MCTASKSIKDFFITRFPDLLARVCVCYLFRIFVCCCCCFSITLIMRRKRCWSVTFAAGGNLILQKNRFPHFCFMNWFCHVILFTSFLFLLHDLPLTSQDCYFIPPPPPPPFFFFFFFTGTVQSELRQTRQFHVTHSEKFRREKLLFSFQCMVTSLRNL